MVRSSPLSSPRVCIVCPRELLLVCGPSAVLLFLVAIEGTSSLLPPGRGRGCSQSARSNGRTNLAGPPAKSQITVQSRCDENLAALTLTPTTPPHTTAVPGAHANAKAQKRTETAPPPCVLCVLGSRLVAGGVFRGVALFEV